MEKRKTAHMLGFVMLALFIAGFLISLLYPLEAERIPRLIKFVGMSCYVIVMSLFLSYPLKIKK